MIFYNKNIESILLRTRDVILFLLIGISTNAQPATAVETVRNYSLAQKRLLMISTAQFTNRLTQNNLDKDSIMIMACRITGLPFLLPYNEGFADKESGGADFINAGKISDAVLLLNKLHGEKKIQLLVELAIWYLHQPGAYKKDVDSAKYFIEAASKLSNSGNYSIWQNECNFLTGELYFQQGKIEGGKNTLIQMATSEQNKKSIQITAHAYELLGVLLPNADSMKLVCYKKSFEIYKQYQFKEKQIKLLWDIVNCHIQTDRHLAEKELYQMLSLQQAIGFKHTLYVQYFLAFSCAMNGNYLNGLSFANAALQNLEWSGMKTMTGAFFTRIGVLYGQLGKEDAIDWFKKAIETRASDNQLFWYKALLYAASSLIFDFNRAKEALLMIKTVSKQYPPITAWEKMEILLTLGYGYDKIGEPKLADKNFMDFLEMVKAFPEADTYSEMSGEFLLIGQLYVAQKNLDKARLFYKQFRVKSQTSLGTIAEHYSLLYKIDSIEHDYKSALDNHIKFKLYYDSATSTDQRKKLDELTVQYAAEKKDQDIKLLKQQGIVQQAELKQNRLTKNIMIAGTALLLIIVGLLLNQFRLKQRTNAAMEKKNLMLQHLVKEKEWLLKEVHHRVKNNLHTVISLLESQAAYLKDDALKAIENSQHRIYAMSLIHQKLYQEEDVKTIDMSVYLPEFIRYLDESFGAHCHIRFGLDIDPLKLGVSQAIPVVLIINEAVTNSIKYAFPGNRKGVIEIAMHKVADQIRLTIADNGIGINPSIINTSSGSLGLKLIKGLSADINANIIFNTDNGTRIIITFNIDPFQDKINSPLSNGKEIFA